MSFNPEISDDNTRSRIESLFGKVCPDKFDSAYINPPEPSSGHVVETKYIPFKLFTQNGEHEVGVSDVIPVDTPKEALDGLVSAIAKVADKDAELYWRQYPYTQSQYDIGASKEQYVAMCRIAWRTNV